MSPMEEMTRTNRYRPVDPKVDFPALEREILAFWREREIFRKTLALREGAPEWVFYEGPPTANGKPGIHHVEPRTFKDVYPRFKTMTGRYVHRKAGWDCHGLPVEVQVEKEIGTRTKRDIEAFGIAEFNRLCRESVSRYVGDFERLTERIGFWINMDEAYWTMSSEYVQSVWWALKKLHEQGLLFQDDRVTAYCPRCGTGLSDHEVAEGYKLVRDPSAHVKFPVVGGRPEVAGASLVAWTTTPWTLVSNLGLAVAPEERYMRVRLGGEDLIVARARRAELGEGGETVRELAGRSLVGLSYEPPYPNVDDNTHRVVPAGFVSMQEGTGIVHMAPAFGPEDLEVGRREGWPVFKPVDDEGRFTTQAPDFIRGRFVKEADRDIIEDLRERGRILRAQEHEHTYPLCWRCDTPLIYYARRSWYIRTTARKQELLAANEKVNWYPDHIKHGRYGDWLANNVDWSLSRERYWGTPLPVWTCESGHDTVVGSLDELSQLAGRDVSGMDPHRPAVDEVTISCPRCGEVARRVPDVIDAWFDSGAMPFAQWGYMGPGSAADRVFESRFPADFIAEAIDQTRGWFYSLMAEGVLLFGRSPYENVVCLGHLVDREGRKMSKRLGNVVDPWTVLDRQGADALRWFLVSSGSPWSSRRVYPEAIDDVVRRFLLTLWNTYAFFVTYANLDEPDLSSAPEPADRPVLDRWALSRLHGTVAAVRAGMEAYDATGAARLIAELVDDLSNWYVRRSRRRFWDPARSSAAGDGYAAKAAAHATLEECLLTMARLLAPFTPFIAEELHRNLSPRRDPSAPESVHLCDFPVANQRRVDPGLENAMALARSAVSLGRTVRAEAKLKVRQPLPRAVVHLPSDASSLEPLLELVAEELNVKQVSFARSAEQFTGWRAKPNFRALGPRLGSRVGELAEALRSDDGSAAAALADGRDVVLHLPSGEVLVSPGDVELTQQNRPGWGVASEGSLTLALDLEPTEDLRREGVAREVLHQVQALRKSAGLEVSDRIVLGIESDVGVRAAVAAHRDYLAAEALALEVLDRPVDHPARSTELSIDGAAVRLSLRPVSGRPG